MIDLLTRLKAKIEEGYVHAHRRGTLTIYTYTKPCMYAKAWDSVTRAARGLVLDDVGNVIARPFTKFFNLNEHVETKLENLPKETPELAMKMDGSLVIVFWNPYDEAWEAITTGSWDNVQTRAAKKWLPYHQNKLSKQYTYLFELVAPWNRIVVKYPMEEMILLGIVDTVSGYDYSYAEVEAEGRLLLLKTVAYEKKPIDALTLDDKKVKDQEGYVARFSNGLRVKLKYDQYLYLHKIMTDLSVKGIWERLSTGCDEEFPDMPDEFMDWYVKERDGLKKAYKDIEDSARKIVEKTPKFETQKEYAAYFYGQHKDIAPLLFLIMKNQDYKEYIWDRIKPVGQTATFQQPGSW